MEGKLLVYGKIYVPLDNSDHSHAARMHQVRRKPREYTLPEEYQHQQQLGRQRKIHDSLITRGLQLISDSYLYVMKTACDRAGLPFEYTTFDRKNWECLV